MQALDQLETPALLLDAAQMERNIARMRAHLQPLGVTFRPHVKTHKSIDVARRMMATTQGPITVSTLLEADYFSAHGVTDILYAVCIAPNKFDHVAALQARGVKLTLILDSLETARLLVDRARSHAQRFDLLIDTMLVISEKEARALVGIDDALQVVQDCFATMARNAARNYPVVREATGHRDAVFGVKAGCDDAAALLGLKAGGYWPQNMARGLGNHQSSTLLFDRDTGCASALVSANYLTGIRTGAASAVATRFLSRPDSRVLGLIGAGVQAIYQLDATLAVRVIEKVVAWDPSADNLAPFGRAVTERGLEFIAAERQQVAQQADVLITVTPSTSALVEQGWVRPGTHINAMGADTRGKQELDPALVARAALFVDEVAQALQIGECQHAFGAGLITAESLRGSLGAVVAGLCEGRRSDTEITLFDGTGVALQDLAVADLALRLARQRGFGSTVAYQDAALR